MSLRPDATVAFILLGIAFINGAVKVLTALIALKAVSLRERSGALDRQQQVADLVRPLEVLEVQEVAGTSDGHHP